MLPFDDSVQKRVGNRRHRSEAEHRLYWSTCEKMMARQAPAPQRKIQVWIRVRRLFGVLRRWWHEHIQTDMHAGGEGAQLSQFISEKGKV
jgi:hypothetical protein